MSERDEWSFACETSSCFRKMITHLCAITFWISREKKSRIFQKVLFFPKTSFWKDIGQKFQIEASKSSYYSTEFRKTDEFWLYRVNISCSALRRLEYALQLLILHVSRRNLRFSRLSCRWSRRRADDEGQLLSLRSQHRPEPLRYRKLLTTEAFEFTASRWWAAEMFPIFRQERGWCEWTSHKKRQTSASGTRRVMTKAFKHMMLQ